MVTSNCLLITRLELTKSTFWRFLLGKTLYKLSLSDLLPDPKVLCISLPTISKLDTSSWDVGIPPSRTPVTVLSPTTVNEVGFTPITLLIEGNVFPDLYI